MAETAANYHDAALERIGDAMALKRIERYSFAMYAAGVAAESMLRAFRLPDRAFDSGHDLVDHFKACDQERLGEAACRRLRPAVQTAHLLWLNKYRYWDEDRLRQHLNDIKYYRRVARESDTLKVACIELTDAALQIVTVGDERWKNP